MFGSSGQDASWQILVGRFINLEPLVFETLMFGSSGQDASWQILVGRFINLEPLVFETVIHMYLTLLMPTTTTESDPNVALA